MIVPVSRDTSVRPGGSNVLGHLLSIKQVANACQLSEKAVRRAIDDGELPAVKLRSRLRVVPQDFEAWITANRRRGSRVGLDPRARRARRTAAGTFRALAQADTESGLSQ